MTDGIREPERLTPVTAAQVFDAMTSAWPFAFDPTPARVRVPLAQSALETGRWNVMRNYNPGNKKSSVGDGRRHVYFYCNEVMSRSEGTRDIAQTPSLAKLERDLGRDSKGKDLGLIVGYYPDHPQARFRAYQTLEAGIGEYLRMLRDQKNFKAAVPFIEAADPAQYVTKLKQGGYFTAPLGPYLNTVQRLYDEFSSLDHGYAVETVADVQRALNLLGYSAGAVDGDAGPLTKGATLRFQRDHGLVMDGIAGPQTKRALAMAVAAKHA